MRFAPLLFLFLTATWIVLLLTAPVAGAGALASGLTYAFASLICHQRPERSFHFTAAQLPVCARCCGLYAGAAMGALIGSLRPAALSLDAARSALSDRRRAALRLALVVAAIPTAITWGSEVLGLWSAANVTRFIAALPLGAAVAVTVNYIECARRQRTGLKPPRIHM